MADEWVTITEEDEWETIPESGFRGAGATGTWKELTPVQKAGQAVKELVAAPVRTLESMIGSMGGLIRMGAESATIGAAITKNNINIPGAGIIAEHLIRKYGPNRALSFYDRKIKKYADAGKKISDFWAEQANKGWEAPNPDIVEARWSERPASKTVSAVSSGLTSIGVVVGTTVLTKQPQAGLALLAASETGSMYDRLRNKNVPPDIASKLAQMAGAWTYVTEKIGFDKLLKPTSRTVMNAMKKSGWEGAQEVIEGAGHNLLEYFGYDYRKPQDIPTAVKAAVDHMMDGWVDNLVGGIGAGGLTHLVLPGTKLREPGEPITTPPTVEELTKKPIEEIAPQTPDHAIGHKYGLTNEQVDSKLDQAELRYRELKLKETGERTPTETDELAFLSRNRTNIEAILERETRPVTPPPIKRTRKNLLALGHKIAREAELSDEEYRDFAEIITGKRSMSDMSKAERNEFVAALEESYGTPKELLPEDYDIPINVAGRETSMREVYDEAVKTIAALIDKKKVPATIKIGFGKTGTIQGFKNFFFGIDNTPPYHLARILDGGTEGIFSEVIDKGIESFGITDADLAKMGESVNPRLQTHQMISKGAATEIFSIEINGKNYEMTIANLLDIYLISNQEAGMRHLTKGGLVIEGVETGPLSEEQIIGLRERIDENPKARKIADTILEIGELIWKPSINQVSQRLEGKEIAVEPDWWGLEVYMPKRLAGKTRMGKLGKLGQFVVNLLEDKGILKDRTRSTAPLVLRDAFRRFSVFESAIAEYVGMAEASRTSRTILNDPTIATVLDQKGYNDVRKRILKIHEQAQSLPAFEGNFSAWFAKRLPGLYRAVLFFNPRVVASQKTSTFNYGAYVSPKYRTMVAGLKWENIQETLELSDVAWDRFHMGHSSLELGEAAQSDAALRMWTGGKSSDINKAGWAMKITDISALTDGMKAAQDEYQDARKGTIEGLSAEWWLDKDNLPEANIELWRKVQEEGENADPEERQAVEQWRKLVTDRAEYLWQRTQPSWDKWNRSTLTSQKGIRRLFLLFRSFHEKSLTIFNEAKLDYENSAKTLDDKTKFVQKTGPVLAGYTANMFLRLAIMAAITRELKEPVKYFEEFLTSWTAMFPIFGKVLKTTVNRFVDTLAGAKPTYIGEAVESYPVRVVNMVLKSPVDFAEATAHLVSGDNEDAKEAFERAIGRLAEGIGILSGIPVPEIKRTLPKEEKESTKRHAPTRKAPSRGPAPKGGRGGPTGRR